MKRLMLAGIIALSSVTYAADNTEFAKAEQLYQAKNFPAAYQEMDRIAKTGNAQAIYNVGYMNELGQGVNKDIQKAISSYQDASAKGYSVASYRLAQIYNFGELGIAADQKQGRSYLEKASSQGLDTATVELAGLLLAEDKPASTTQALQKLNPLVQKNNLQAIHLKAIYDMSNGLKTHNDAAVKVGLASMENLAKKGYVPALMAVANMLTKGNLVNQNLPEARKIFAALAQDNVPNAKESLAEVDKLIAQKKPS